MMNIDSLNSWWITSVAIFMVPHSGQLIKALSHQVERTSSMVRLALYSVVPLDRCFLTNVGHVLDLGMV